METAIIENPVTDTTTDDSDPLIAHVINKNDHMLGYVFGEPVLALCGYVFVPSRDPKNRPMCDACKEEVRRIIRQDD
jgi:hypothetical protein